MVDVTGAVVGLNTFILSSGGGSEGLGFAIPARIVDFVYHGLRKYGHVHHIEIGVVAQTITPTMAEGLGLAHGWGVIVVGEAPGFNTVNTGLRAGDVIHSLNRTPVATVEQLRIAVAQLKPGDAAVLRIERQGQFQYLAFEME